MTSPHGILRRLHGAEAGYDITDPGDAGTIVVDRQFGVCMIDSGGAETRTLPVPTYAGAHVYLVMIDDDGAVTVTVTNGYDQAGNTTFVLDDVFDVAHLMSVYDKDNNAYEWRLMNGGGAGGLTGVGTDITTEGDITLADGGTVTQATSITTGVTLNTHSGQITTVSQTVAAASEATFTVTNSVITATSTVIVNVATNNGNGTFIAAVTDVQAGQFDITVANLHASAAGSATLVINFAVIEGASS